MVDGDRDCEEVLLWRLANDLSFVQDGLTNHEH